MHIAVLEAPRKFVIKDFPLPVPGSEELLIRVKACGVCHSEMAVWDGSAGSSYPLYLGHEVSGIVEKTGPMVQKFSPGDRVAIYTDGKGYAEYLTIPARNAIRLAEHVSFEEAMGEPIACVVNAINRMNIGLGDTVVLIGVGFMGLIMTQLVRLQGAGRVVAVDYRDRVLEKARELGADICINPQVEDPKKVISDLTEGRGADLVIEMTGNQDGLDLASELTRIRGKLIIFGFHVGAPRRINMFLWNWRGLDVINAHERDPKVYIEGMRIGISLLETGRLQMTPLISSTCGLDEINQMFDKVYSRTGSFIKAVIQP